MTGAKHAYSHDHTKEELEANRTNYTAYEFKKMLSSLKRKHSFRPTKIKDTISMDAFVKRVYKIVTTYRDSSERPEILFNGIKGID